MNLLDEYRRNAQECQRMADNAANPADKASWLRLAASWLTMIRNDSKRFFAKNGGEAAKEPRDRPRSWPTPSKEDSKASH